MAIWSGKENEGKCLKEGFGGEKFSFSFVAGSTSGSSVAAGWSANVALLAVLFWVGVFGKL